MNNTLQSRIFSLVLVISAFFTGLVHAEKAIHFTTTESWAKSSGTGVYGWQFTVRSNILVSSLGLYDDWDIISGQLIYNNGLREPHTIAIWDLSDPVTPLASSVIPAGTAAPLLNGFRSVGITPLELSAGHQYVIAATYTQGQDYTTGIYNNPDFDLTINPAIGFGGYRYGGSSNTLAFPEGYTPDVEYSFGPNFAFTVVPGTNMIYWQHDDGRVATWQLHGTNFQRATPLFKHFDSTSWRLVGVNDFDRDHKPDFLWHLSNSAVLYGGLNESGLMEKFRLRWRGPLEHSWRLAGFGDFNFDTHKDMLWQNTNGVLEVWFMNGLDILGYSLLQDGQPVDAGWRAIGVDDLNQDSHADILWQRDDGQVAVWTMNQTNLASMEGIRDSIPVGNGWRIAGLSDFDLDGDKDILLRNKDGRLGVWVMQGTTFVRSIPLRRGSPRSAGWRIVGVQ